MIHILLAVGGGGGGHNSPWYVVLPLVLALWLIGGLLVLYRRNRRR